MSAGMEQVQGLALQQTLSPQMQQSLHILQAPIAELRQLVAAELAENPAIEEVPGEVVAVVEEPRSAMEDAWGDAYAQSGGGEGWSAEAQERRQFFFDSQTRPQTLQEFVLGQLVLEDVPRRLRPAAELIVGNLDSWGYYRGPIEEAAYPLGLTVAEAEEALDAVQRLDPPGVGARSLGECLGIQFRRAGRGESLAARIVEGHLEDLARRRFPEIARELGVTAADVARAAEEIRALDPRPGLAFAADENRTIVPEVVVWEEEDGQFHVGLNDSELPHVRVADGYKDMITAPGQTREVRDFLREKIRGGRFFIKCIEQRQQTVLAIAREIVARQEDFFRHGPSRLRPMTMAQVAAAVGVHETTVSRAVSGKFLESPQGLFELKYFFTTGYTTDDGEALSNEGVRRAIADIVKGEDPQKPLSDQHIAEALSESGVRVARRTVAKYREQLGILPSNLRRRL